MINFLYMSPGSIRFTQLTSLDEGYYQCLAYNDYGTAMSNVTFLQRAVLATYSGAVVDEKQLTEGTQLALRLFVVQKTVCMYTSLIN